MSDVCMMKCNICHVWDLMLVECFLLLSYSQLSIKTNVGLKVVKDNCWGAVLAWNLGF